MNRGTRTTQRGPSSRPHRHLRRARARRHGVRELGQQQFGIRAAAPTNRRPGGGRPPTSTPGPYSVGTTTLDLDGARSRSGTRPTGCRPGRKQVIFEIRDLLPENLKTLVPDDLNPKYPPTPTATSRPAARARSRSSCSRTASPAIPPSTSTSSPIWPAGAWWSPAPDFNERACSRPSPAATRARDEDRGDAGHPRSARGRRTPRPSGLLSGKVDTDRRRRRSATRPAWLRRRRRRRRPVDQDLRRHVGRPRSGSATDTQRGTTFADLAVPTQPGMVVTGGKDQVAHSPTVCAASSTR